MNGSFKLNIQSQYNITTLIKADLEQFTGQTVCEMPGIEFIVPTPFISEVHTRGKKIKPSTTKVLLFNGTEKHTEIYQNVTGQLQSVVIAKDYLNKLCDPLGVNASEILFDPVELEQGAEISTLMNKLIHFSKPEHLGSSMTVDCLATELALLTLTRYNHTDTFKINRAVDSGHFPVSIDKMKRVIHSHIGNAEFDLDQLSKEVGLSKFHMIRVFRDAVGASPAKYLARIKIDLAKELLSQTKNSIISISTELGFDHLSTFNKSFKATTGLSPSQYRSQHNA
ncbi:hypothetical protein CIK05_11960 [Bdellovibrio sp. qaytius]|nr:hypothetical protein CIK05_11960 [Bdellovibrio sp. qaytius]